MFGYLFNSRISGKRAITHALIPVFVVILGLCVSLFVVMANDDSPITLHHASHIHIVSVYYANGNHNKYNDKALGDKVNNYLNRITNLHKYHVSIKPSPVGSDNADGKEDTLTETIQLNRK